MPFSGNKKASAHLAGASPASIGSVTFSNYADGGTVFNATVLKKLYGKILGQSTATYDQLKTNISGGYKNFANFGDIVLEFGGFKWAVTYVTEAKNGDISATLILSEVIPNENYQYNSYSASTANDYPSNMYSSSIIRVKTLNAGGDDGAYAYNSDGDGSSKYASTGNALNTVTKNERVNNRWSAFTLSSDLIGKKSLTDYILQPTSLAYQSDENYMNYYNASSTTSAEGGTLSPNDAYGIPQANNGVAGSTRWYIADGENLNYGGDTSTGQATNVKAGYSDWQYDYLWLASIAEMGTPSFGAISGKAINGLWGIPSNRLQGSSIRAASNDYWLRTGGLGSYQNAMYVEGASTIVNSGTITPIVATSTAKLRPCLHLNLTAAENGSKVKAPTADTTEFVYDGGTKTYKPEGFDANVMNVSGNTASAVGTTTVTVTLKSGYVWSDGATEADGTTPKKYEFDFTIVKGTPIVEPIYDKVNKRYPTSGLPKLTNKGTAGSFVWKPDQTPVVGTKSYAYTFTPADTVNWNTYDGTIEITYDQPTVKSLTVSVADGAVIYDVYTADDLNDKLKVEVTYDDNSTAVLVSSEFTVTITTNNGALVADGANTLWIEVGDFGDSFSLPEVVEAKINSFVLVQLSVTSFTYPVQESDIIAALSQVRVKWNYNPNSAVALTDFSILSVAGTLDAGTQTLKLKFGDVESDGFTVTINKGTYEIKATLADGSATYDGTPKGLEVKFAEEIEGVEAEYLYECAANGYSSADRPTDAGEYAVTVSFKHGNPNYNGITEKLTAKLIIEQADYPDADKISFEDKTVSLGTHTLTAENVPEGVTVRYFDAEGNEFTGASEVGEYEITAKFTHGNPNYKQIADKTARLKITDKKLFDKTGLGVSGAGLTVDGKNITATYTGEAFEITPTGTLRDESGAEVTAEYTTGITLKRGGDEVSEIKDAGVYTVIISYTLPADGEYADYEESFEIRYTLTVSTSAYLPEFSFEDKTVEYNGEKHMPEVTGEIPDWLTVKYYVGGGEFDGAEEIGEYEITVKFTHDNPAYGEIADMSVRLTVTKAKVKLPEYKGSYAYTGAEITVTPQDFEGFDEAKMSIEASVGKSAGGYKATVTLTDGGHYEWESGGAGAEIEWEIKKAVITASKTAGRLPEYTSESYKGSFEGVVGYKYYTDKACTEEVHPDDVAEGVSYYVKAVLNDTENFEVEDEAYGKYFEAGFALTPDAEDEGGFLKDYWLYIVIGAGALLLIIILTVALTRRRSREPYDDYYDDYDEDEEDEDEDYDDEDDDY